ncbi:MAG: peptidoglycan-binding protein [Stappiaceae bacterium]
MKKPSRAGRSARPQRGEREGREIRKLRLKKPVRPSGRTRGIAQRTVELERKESMVDPTKVIPIPDDINDGLSSAKNSTMLQVLGMPRDSVDRKCRTATNDPVKSLLTTKSVGPFRVTGIKPAVASLKSVLALVKNEHPNVIASLETAGMHCVRKIAGSNKLSNHSWGCAVDIRVGGILDGLGSGKRDGKTLAGLAAMAPFFNDAGWYWGVGFSNFEDGMHFEVADETIRAWHADGTLGADVATRSTTPSNLSLGDRGTEVRELQRALAKLGYDILDDGEFGPITHGIVIDFQAMNGLVPDGIVGPKTKSALGLS